MKASKQDLLAAGWAEEKVEAMTRQQRRRLIVARPSRSRTGQPAHFKAWQAEGRIKSILQRMPLGSLADSLSDGDHATAKAFAILAVNSSFRNVWNLGQATMEDVLAVRGIGPANLAIIEAYLKSRNVPLAWTAN